MSNANTELLVRMAEVLGALNERLVFVGGCATALLMTDSAAAPVRATQDVDAIVAVATLPEYQRLGEALMARGFRQTAAEGEPPYRWSVGGMKLDVMPVEEKVLGFSNRWYALALHTAVPFPLPAGPSIRLITPACFLATKLEAFESRGHGDYLESHDLEDVLSLVDGRSELVAECAGADPELRRYVAGVFERLLADTGFLNALPGLVIDGSPATRAPLVVERLRAIVAGGGLRMC